MENEQGEFKKNLVELMELQQEANKKNLVLQVGNLILNILIFIMLVVIVVLK